MNDQEHNLNFIIDSKTTPKHCLFQVLTKKSQGIKIMTLFPKENDNVNPKDMILYLAILLGVCLILYIHTIIKKIIRKRIAKKEVERDKEQSGEQVDVITE